MQRGGEAGEGERERELDRRMERGREGELRSA